MRPFSEFIQGGPKKYAFTDLSINRFIRKKSTVILDVHELRNDSILYQVLCTASSIKYSMVSITDTRMRRSSTRAMSIHKEYLNRAYGGLTGFLSIHTIIDVTASSAGFNTIYW